MFLYICRKNNTLDSIKKAITNVCILFLSCGFLGVGMLKLTNYESMDAAFTKWGLPEFIKYGIGFFEVVLAMALFYKPTRKLAAIAAFLLMVGAVYIHFSNDEVSQLYGPSLVVFLLTGLILSDDLI